MRFLVALAAFLTATAALPTLDDVEADLVEREFDEATEAYGILDTRQARKRKPHCHPNKGVHIILAAGGNGGPVHKNYGLLTPTINALRERFPGTTNYSIPYPRPGQDPTIVAAGVDLLTANLEWYTAGCPTTPIVLLGYSLGAIMTSNTLCGRSINAANQSPPISSKYFDQIITYIALGDLTFRPGFATDVGTCNNGQGKLPRFDESKCDPYKDRIHQYCDSGDPNCCVGSPGQDVNIHFGYPQKYLDSYIGLIQFTLKRYRQSHK